MASARRVAFNLLTFTPVLGGLAPVQEHLRKRAIGAEATSSARYCYAVWMRHLGKAIEHGASADPQIVAELGPGASLGIGLAALLCGAERYYAFDVVRHVAAGRNQAVFEELVRLFEQRAQIPDAGEFPQIRPSLASYTFPHDVLTPERMERSLAPRRVERIRRSLERIDTPGSMLQYRAPWTDSGIIEDNAVDFVLSQAVFEHIDDLTGAYRTMRRWLRPGGLASHTIDFRSHGWSRRWDGHWGYSDLAWRMIRGRDIWAINREPCSTHRRLLAQNGLRIVGEQLTRTPATLAPRDLAPRFRALTNEDRTVSGAYFLCVK